MPTAVKDAPVSDIDFRSAKKLRQNLDQTINGYNKRRNCKKREAAKVSISMPDGTDLSNFYTELNSCKASVSELDSSFL